MSIPTPKSLVSKSDKNRAYKKSPIYWSSDDLVDGDHYGDVTYLNLYPTRTDHPKQYRYSNLVFDGVCVDTGAQVSVCGRRQAMAYCKNMQIPFSTRPSTMTFKFGDVVSPSIGVMKFRFPPGRRARMAAA